MLNFVLNGIVNRSERTKLYLSCNVFYYVSC